MNDCPREPENLSAFVDGELPPARQRQTARHLMGCDDCAAQAGRLLAVKSYLGAGEGQTVALTQAFWRRFDQALDLVDAMGDRMAPRPQRQKLRPRLAALALAGVLVIAVAWGLRLRTLAPQVTPQVLVAAHRSLAGQVTSGPFHSVGWRQPPLPSSTGDWALEASLARTAKLEGVTQDLYDIGASRLSAFAVPTEGLDLRQMESLQVGPRRYYLTSYGVTSLVAWQEQGKWQVLAADMPPRRLLLLAQMHGQISTP
jgi:hypothetical protein